MLERLIVLCVDFSVKPKSTWQILKPHVDTLIARFIFPRLAFGEDRAELWSFDQVEYIRRTIGSLFLSFGRVSLFKND